MNTKLPPFNNLKARQAVNYAIDRNAPVKIFGGPKLAVAVVPGAAAGLPGPQATTARTRRTRAAASGRRPTSRRRSSSSRSRAPRGQKVDVVRPNDEVNKAMGVYLQSVLNQIGYKATRAGRSRRNISSPYVQNTKNKVADQRASSGTRTTRLRRTSSTSCSAASRSIPGSDSSINIAGFCDKKINAQMHQALKLGRHRPSERDQRQWAQIDRMVTDQAPMADAVQPEAHRLRLEARRQLHRSASSSTGCVDQSWVK